MKRFGLIGFILLVLVSTGFAQPGKNDSALVDEGVIVVRKPLLTKTAPGSDRVDTINGDLHSDLVKKKPPVVPFVKVEYSLYLSSVKEVPVIREVNGQQFRDKVPVFDSLLYARQPVEPVYPQKASSLSRYFSEHITYQYKPEDSLRSDTMIIGLWITPTGKIKWAEADTAMAGSMPRQLRDEISYAAAGLREWGWGKGGGFNTKRRFLRPSEFRSESYYCELIVIVSGKPQTIEQQTTKVRFAPFDIPLNSPPSDAEHRNSIEKNRRIN